MSDPLTLTFIIGYLAKSAPSWLDALRVTLFNKGKELALEEGKDLIVGRGTPLVRGLFHLDEKEQRRHLELALKNAAERGIARFDTLNKRDQYRDILAILFEPGAHSETLRRETMSLFTLSDSPNDVELNEVYNRSLRFRNLARPTPPPEVDAAPYLSSFLEAMIAELYADPFFREQMSDVLQVRAALSMQRTLTDVLATLRQIGETLADHYTPEQFERDIQAYMVHIERTFRYLKLVGVVPKDLGGENKDPELDGIFVPIRILSEEKVKENLWARPAETLGEDLYTASQRGVQALEVEDDTFQQPLSPWESLIHESLMQEEDDSIIALLQHRFNLVLLGGPGSGKSTVIRYLAWSHAIANLPQSLSVSSNIPLLSGNPLPLRIELRRLTEDRRQRPDYNFLSYASEVLLGREGIEINPQMFKELLERRTMLLLFDGLDEVATLDERSKLVEEIEHFTQRFPGNHMLITSRPVGYELARFSSQWFLHAEIQEFNDQQIRQFLERWYSHVLRLSSLPYEVLQELEILFSTLKENSRLHKLAVNPLLLTVITALHRYERLPDRRVQIYDRCADLLLETWAKLKGTDARWKDMKMVKEDQYACVAHLGFVLHDRSQDRDNSGVDAFSDVATRFMLREIENFLRSRKLIAELATQRSEAKRLLELMRVEVGLIVERGTDENGEALYGFVHRTFQEYFAAADIYERYQQEEDPTIISAFLQEHLHDPHWREVILLLLGKLKRKPVTVQLRQVLEGKIKSQRSCYSDIVQQDLFFVCDCLIEEITVESELAERVTSCLKHIVKDSPFPSQRSKSLLLLGLLMQTRQYAYLGRKALTEIATQKITDDILLRTEAALILYRNSLAESEKQQIIQQVLELTSTGQGILFAKALFQGSPVGSLGQTQAAELLMQLIQKPDISYIQIVQTIQDLYYHSVSAERLAPNLFSYLAEQFDSSQFDSSQELLVAQALFACSQPNSYENILAFNILQRLLRQSNLSVEQRIQIYRVLFDQQEAIQMLVELAQQPDLSFEQAFQVAQELYQFSNTGSEERQQAIKMFWNFAQRPSLSLDLSYQIVDILGKSSPTESEEQQLITRLLLRVDHLLRSFEQTLQVAQTLHPPSFKFPEEQKLTIQILLKFAQNFDNSLTRNIQWVDEVQSALQILLHFVHQGDLSREQVIQAIGTLYPYGYSENEEQELAIQLIWNIAQNQNITNQERLQATTILLHRIEYTHRVRAVRLVLALLQREETKSYFEEHWQSTKEYEPLNSAQVRISDIPLIAELAQQELLPTEARDEMYEILRDMVPQFDKIFALSEDSTICS